MNHNVKNPPTDLNTFTNPLLASTRFCVLFEKIYDRAKLGIFKKSINVGSCAKIQHLGILNKTYCIFFAYLPSVSNYPRSGKFQFLASSWADLDRFFISTRLICILWFYRVKLLDFENFDMRDWYRVGIYGVTNFVGIINMDEKARACEYY